jgi:outer membrane lipoprotein-sorting protein
LLLPALALVVPIAAQAEDQDCAADVTGRVQSHYENVRDLAAHFEQTTRRVSLGDDSRDALVAKGEVVFAKP